MRSITKKQERMFDKNSILDKMLKTYLTDYHHNNQMAVQEYLAQQRCLSPKEMEKQTEEIQKAVITQRNISRSHSLQDILNKKVEDEDNTESGTSDRNVPIYNVIAGEDDTNNIISPELLKSMTTGNWSDTTLGELDDLVKELQQGKILLRRFTQGEISSCECGNEVLLGASIILAAVQKADVNGTNQTLVERVIEREQEGPAQEQIVEAWAKESGLWMNDYTDSHGHDYESLEELLRTEYKRSLYGGSEAEVYWDNDGKTVVKSISLSHADDNPQMLLDRILLDNAYFPAIALEVIGFGRDGLGHFKVMAKQHFVKGTYATKDEIRAYANSIGLKVGGGWWYSPDGRFRVTDLSSLNIMKTDIGELAVFDCDFEMLVAPKGLSMNRIVQYQ
jgi:hypothetical protein